MVVHTFEHRDHAGGGGDIGGKKTWLNAETSLAFQDVIFLGLIVPFFTSVQCGLALSNDEDRKLDRLLLSTPLSPSEYAIGRFLGALVPLLGVLGSYLLLQIMFTELFPREKTDLLGPFFLGNYVRPLVLYSLPLVLFTAGMALFLGTLTGQAVLVFAVPTVLVIGGALFLWDFSPAWLPEWINKGLQWCDPAAVRWFLATFLKEPRGADFLNGASTVPEFPMLVSRLVMAGLGLALVPRLLEARGLDATPPMQARLARAGDPRLVAELDALPKVSELMLTLQPR